MSTKSGFHRQPLKTPESRLATETKAEFIQKVNEHFVEGSNAESGVFEVA